MEERPVRAAVDKGCGERGRILCNEHRGQVGLLVLDCRNRSRKGFRRSACVLDGNAAETEVGTHAGECLVPHSPGDCRNLRVCLRVADPEDNGGRMVEGLLVPVQNCLFPDFEGAHAHPYLHEPDWRPGGGAQNRLCLLVKVRAQVHIGFSAGQFHGEGKTGRVPALLAVLLREQFVDIERLEDHLTAPPQDPPGLSGWQTPAGACRWFSGAGHR